MPVTLKILLNIGTNDQEEHNLPAYKQDELVTVDDQTANKLVYELKIAKVYDPYEESWQRRVDEEIERKRVELLPTGWDRPMSELVPLLMSEEMGYSTEEAERLCKKHHRVMLNGLMGSTHPRPIAMAIELAESREQEGANLRPGE